jgi:hypothetical protein
MTLRRVQIQTYRWLLSRHVTRVRFAYVNRITGAEKFRQPVDPQKWCPLTDHQRRITILDINIVGKSIAERV